MFLWLPCSSFHKRLLGGSTYSHVGFASRIHGFSNRVNEVTANSKIAHFHLPLCIDQHVRGLYICKKEHIPQSLSCMAQAKKSQRASYQQRAPKVPVQSLVLHIGQKLSWLWLLQVQVTASWACRMSCKYPVTCRFPSLIWGVGGSPACSHCVLASWGWPRQSQCSQGHSLEELGPTPGNVCESLKYQ